MAVLDWHVRVATVVVLIDSRKVFESGREADARGGARNLRVSPHQASGHSRERGGAPSAPRKGSDSQDRQLAGILGVMR